MERKGQLPHLRPHHAHDHTSRPGPHSTLLSPPTAPVCPAGRALQLVRRPLTADMSHRSPSQRTLPLRAPRRCPQLRTGRASGPLGSGEEASHLFSGCSAECLVHAVPTLYSGTQWQAVCPWGHRAASLDNIPTKPYLHREQGR